MKIERIRFLTRELNRHRDLYYNKNNPEIDDREYDALFDELQSLEEEAGFRMATSPTQTVGYTPVSALQKTTHTIPLLSLDKIKDPAQLQKMLDREDFLFMPKLDGLTVKLTYINGKLAEAATRGDGEIGEVITHTARTFRDVPVEIPTNEKISIAGEAYVLWEDFNAINEKLPEGEKWKTPRNYAAGSVRQLDPNICAERKITFTAFSPLEGFEDCQTLSDAFRKMQSLGIPTVPFCKTSYYDWTHTTVHESAIAEMKNAAEEKGWPRDGVVIRYDNLAYGESKGRTGHHYKYAVAFKFEDETEVTTLRDIEWTVGRTGVLTPTAVFDPVELDGTNVERASLHNIGIIKGLKLGIGDTVKVAKMNMIIPQITENLTKSDTYRMIVSCPECGGFLVRSEVGNGSQTVCENKDCPGRHLERFTYFVSKDAMDIKGLSRATLKTLIRLGHLKKLSDLYGLHAHRYAMTVTTGFGVKTADKVLAAIEKSRRCTLERYITSLGIPEVGKSAAKIIAADCDGSYTTFISRIGEGYDWTKIATVGEIMNNSILGFFRDPDTREEAVTLAANLIFDAENPCKNVRNDTVFAGKNVVLSGKIDGYTKAEAEKILTEAGAIMQSTVNAATNYLIYEEGFKETAKSRMAKQKNIPIISFAKAMEMLEK